jgi:hypothetical protein
MTRAARHSLSASPGGLHRVMEQQVPSGQKVELYEVLLDQVGDQDWVRFRFVAPQIGKAEPALSYQQSMADIERLCSDFAVPYLQEFDLAPHVVSITLMDRPVAFGSVDTDATQYIEAFQVDDKHCVLEGMW